MAIDFSKLKKNRGNSLAALTEKLEELNKGGSSKQKDERIYRPAFDKKAGKNQAIVRFLPAKEGDPFVRVFSHGFKGPGGWYIENSRSTIGEEDPVGISNGLYWRKGEAEGNESLKNIARARKRKTTYYANVLVLKDSMNPELEGKVMIYQFGSQIYSMIEKAIKPEFEDDDPIDPFDLWNGADFKIKMVGREIPDSRTGEKVMVPNYESSEFARPSELFEGDDEKKEEVFNQTYDLSEFVVVKDFDELAKQFKRATGEEYNALEGGDPAEAVADRVMQQAQQAAQQDNSPAVGPSVDPSDLPFDPDPSDKEEEDDVMAMFRRLAEQ